jgi:hypothetical protein
LFCVPSSSRYETAPCDRRARVDEVPHTRFGIRRVVKANRGNIIPFTERRDFVDPALYRFWITRAFNRRSQTFVCLWPRTRAMYISSFLYKMFPLYYLSFIFSLCECMAVHWDTYTFIYAPFPSCLFISPFQPPLLCYVHFLLVV